MSNTILLPKLGNSVESCIIVSWLKQVGEPVTEGEALCTVETDKTTMEVVSTASGKLLKHLVNVGDDVPVMTAIAEVETEVESGEWKAESLESQKSFSIPNSQLSITTQAPVSPRARKLAHEMSIDTTPLQGSGPGGRIIERDIQVAATAKPITQSVPARITPLAQRMAQELNIDPATISGSGPRGQITREDLQRVPKTPSTQSTLLTPPTLFIPSKLSEPSTPDPHTSPIPLTSIRRVIAERMRASLQNTAQLTLNASADARALQSYRKRLKASDTALGLSDVTINDLILFAVARTLPQFPELNATFTDGLLIQHAHVQLGFAVDTPRGLLVPVIPAANLLPLRALAQSARQLAALAREGKLTPDQMRGGSFTISNLGQFGIESFTPILNTPQVAILGVGNINLKAVATDDGEIEHIPHLSLSLTIDHQVVDGAPAAKFLQALAKNMAQFELLLAG